MRPGIATESTDEILKRWVLLYLDRIEKKDIRGLRRMMKVNSDLSDIQFCPFAVPEVKLQERVTDTEGMVCVHGKSCTLIYAKSGRQKLPSLCFSKAGDSEFRLNAFFFFIDDSGKFYVRTQQPEAFTTISFEE